MNEMEQPLLTIGVPTYNGSKTIRYMMDLLLEQYDSRVEILVSDNCSTDATPLIIKEYMEKHPYIRYVRNEKNIGPDANFLQCMRLAKGKFIYLLSDDDVMLEGGLEKILSFLTKYPDTSLAYLYTVGFRGKYTGLENCSQSAKRPKEDICTSDRDLFMKYAGYYWGFMSSYLISKRKFDQIGNAEQYFGTYWLQAYIYLLCCTDKQDLLGVIAGPCIGAGVYVNVNNFDTSLVDGIYYKTMLKFANDHSHFSKSQLEKLYKWRILFLGLHAVIKEKAAGIRKTSKWGLFKCTWRYPIAWIKLYPAFFLPNFVCKLGMQYYRKKKHMEPTVSQQRVGDV